MNCSPHPQVISPCADDGVSVGQALGTRGDVAYDEDGSLALTVGQTSVDVPFRYTKESKDYVFEYLYIKTEDAAPVDIRPVPNSQTKRGFTCELTGTPITANSVLKWRVVVPDPLHTCQGLTAGPQYAIIPPPQQGIEPFPQGENQVIVTFPVVQPDATWEFEALTVEAEPTDPATDPQVFAYVITGHTATGFRMMFSGSPDSDRYSIHWRIA